MIQEIKNEENDIAECVRELAEDSEENPTTRLDRIEKRLYDISICN